MGPVIRFVSAGLPALQGGEPGQVRKEAATAIYCECRGQARHFLSSFACLGVPINSCWLFESILALG